MYQGIYFCMQIYFTQFYLSNVVYKIAVVQCMIFLFSKFVFLVVNSQENVECYWCTYITSKVINVLHLSPNDKRLLLKKRLNKKFINCFLKIIFNLCFVMYYKNILFCCTRSLK